MPIYFGKCKKSARASFMNEQKRDAIKRDWCQRNGVPLLEIPYWDFDKIETLVERFVRV